MISICCVCVKGVRVKQRQERMYSKYGTLNCLDSRLHITVSHYCQKQLFDSMSCLFILYFYKRFIQNLHFFMFCTENYNNNSASSVTFDLFWSIVAGMH